MREGVRERLDGYTSTFHIRGTLQPGADVRGSSSTLQLEFGRVFASSDPLVKEAPRPLDEERSPWKLHVRPW